MPAASLTTEIQITEEANLRTLGPILAKKIIFHGDKRTDYGNLRRFRERCKDIGHFDIYDLRSLLSLINTECPDYFSAHHIHRETNDGTSQSEIYAFIGEHVLNYMMRFSPQYLKAAWSDRLLDMRQFDKYFLKELEEWVINYEKSLTEAFSALRKDMKHDMRLNKFSNIMHGIFSRKEKSKHKKNTIEPIRNCPH